MFRKKYIFILFDVVVFCVFLTVYLFQGEVSDLLNVIYLAEPWLNLNRTTVHGN